MALRIKSLILKTKRNWLDGVYSLLTKARSKIKKSFKRIRKKVILFKRRVGSFIRIELKNKVPRLVIHEKYKIAIQWILRGAATAGIISGFLSLTIPVGVILSLVLLIIEQFLEKAVFVYTSLYVQAMPPEYKETDWRGMLFGIPREEGYPFVLGMIFDSEESARRIFRCIETWNQDEGIDKADNIKISFIIEGNNKYRTYIYPSHNREPIIKAAKEVEKGKGKNEKHQQLIMQLLFCKVFDYNENSNFKKFHEEYAHGKPFQFGAYTAKGGEFYRVSGTTEITKTRLKIKHRKDLTSEDHEYDHGRFIIDNQAKK